MLVLNSWQQQLLDCKFFLPGFREAELVHARLGIIFFSNLPNFQDV